MEDGEEESPAPDQHVRMSAIRETTGEYSAVTDEDHDHH